MGSQYGVCSHTMGLWRFSWGQMSGKAGAGEARRCGLTDGPGQREVRGEEGVADSCSCQVLRSRLVGKQLNSCLTVFLTLTAICLSLDCVPGYSPALIFISPSQPRDPLSLSWEGNRLQSTLSCLPLDPRVELIEL